MAETLTAAAGGIAALAKGLADEDFEAARRAKRALWKIVYEAGRPGAGAERAAVVGALLPLLGKDNPAVVRREALWLISETGGDEAVDAVAALVGEKEFREDAVMVLDHIPGAKSLAALKAAFGVVPEDFKMHVVQALRHRGEQVDGYPCRKLVPTRETQVGK